MKQNVGYIKAKRAFDLGFSTFLNIHVSLCNVADQIYFETKALLMIFILFKGIKSSFSISDISDSDGS